MRKAKVLMLDDDAELGKSFKRYFELKGDWEFEAVAEAEAALKRLDEFRPDALILDCDLGEGEEDGFELLKRLRRQGKHRDLTVLVLTGARKRPKEVAQGLNLGADQYVTKPISPQALEARVLALLRWMRRSAPKPEALP